jgi:uncharacterized protein (TIGR03067 family)
VGSSRRKWLALIALLAAAAFGVWYFALRGPRDDLGRFQGQWQVAVPVGVRDNQTVAKVKPVQIRVTGERWVYVAGETERQYAMTLRPEADPKEIDLVLLDRAGNPTKFVLRGIYQIEGDRAKVVTSIGDEERPTKFDDPDGPPGLLLERVR